MCWTLDLIVSSCPPQPKLLLCIFFLRPHPCLTKPSSPFPLFITFLPPQSLASFPFFVLLSLVYSTWAQVSLGHCNLRNGAGTLLLLYISFTSTPVLRSRRHATLPSTFPHFLVFFFCCLSPHTCTSTNCRLSPAPAISIVLSVCIQPCVFPILSRLVVLLYMALSLVTAGVSHHLYVFTMLSFDDAPNICVCVHSSPSWKD